jgi:hypothetical protein
MRWDYTQRIRVHAGTDSLRISLPLPAEVIWWMPRVRPGVYRLTQPCALRCRMSDQESRWLVKVDLLELSYSGLQAWPRCIA